jgi:hypothetical protein
VRAAGVNRYNALDFQAEVSFWLNSNTTSSSSDPDPAVMWPASVRASSA